jgi:4a-hydroxytetrahydrobiopterin dehydratase
MPPLDPESASQLLRALNSNWAITADGRRIQRNFRFADFVATMGFVNAVAGIAEAEDHHPDLEVSYGNCVVNYTTHAIDGLSENDFICAAKIDQLANG